MTDEGMIEQVCEWLHGYEDSPGFAVAVEVAVMVWRTAGQAEAQRYCKAVQGRSLANV